MSLLKKQYKIVSSTSKSVCEQMIKVKEQILQLQQQQKDSSVNAHNEQAKASTNAATHTEKPVMACEVRN